MNEAEGIKRSLISRDKLPMLFPTHQHSHQFWEQLGRAVATFGFLEEVLKKAIFAFTATRSYNLEEGNAAYKAWAPQLENVLVDQLYNLAEKYEKAVRDHSESTVEGAGYLVEKIKEANNLRNVLCHGSWRLPDAEGRSIPFFINRKKEVFETPVDVVWLGQVQTSVAELACGVIDTVTYMGWQFPGGAGPGMVIWPPDR